MDYYQKAAPSRNGNLCSSHDKGNQKKRNYKYSATKSASYATLSEIRPTEESIVRALFLSSPYTAYSRYDVSDHLERPINHATRVVSDLLACGFIEPCGTVINPLSGKRVQALRLKPRPEVAIEQSLFREDAL